MEGKETVQNDSMTLNSRTIERKIGTTTFIVSSRFSDGEKRDIVTTLARLMEHDEE